MTKNDSVGFWIFFILALVTILYFQGYIKLGSVVNPYYEFDWKGYHWKCTGNIGATDGVDADFSDGYIVGNSNANRCNTDASITVSETNGIGLSSRSGTYGGCGTQISCQITNFSFDKYDKVIFKISGFTKVSGDGTCKSSLNLNNINHDLSCPNYPYSNQIDYSDITIQKLIGGRYVTLDALTQTSSSLPITFSISSSTDSGKTVPYTSLSITDMILVESSEGQINYLTMTLSEKTALLNSLNSTIFEKAQIIQGLQLTAQEQGVLINNLNLNIQQQSQLILELTAKSNEQADIINAMNLNIDEQAELINALTQDILEQANLINQLTTNLQIKAQLVNSLTAENDRQAQLISEMKESFSNQGIIIDALNKTIVDDASIIKSLNLNLADQSSVISGLKLSNLEQAELIKSLSLNLDEQASIIANLKNTQAEKEEIIKNLASSLEEQKKLSDLYNQKLNEINEGYYNIFNLFIIKKSVLPSLLLGIGAIIFIIFLLAKK
jgi:hypothetical protein